MAQMRRGAWFRPWLFFLAFLLWSSSARGEPRRVELVLDFSSSMAEPVEGAEGKTTALEVLFKAVENVIEVLEPDAHIGVRAYGHRVDRAEKSKSCQDSELVVPFGAATKERVLEPLRKLGALGFSPIAYALSQVAADLGPVSQGDSVVLVSDGADTCGGDPIAVLRRLQKSGVRVRVDTVGIRTSPSAGNVLQQLAEVSGGHFTEIQDLSTLPLLLPQVVLGTVSKMPRSALTPLAAMGRGDLGGFQDAGATPQASLRVSLGRHNGNSIGADGDLVDRFVFQGQQGEKYSVKVVTRGPEAYRIRLFYVDDAGNSLVEGDLENDHEVGLDIFDLGAAARCYVEVRARTGARIEYELELKGLVGF